MSKLAPPILLILIALIGIILPSSSYAQDGENQTFVSADGLFTIQYPAEWILVPETDVRLAFVPTDASNNSVKLDVIFPGSSGMAVGEYAGLSPAAVIDLFRANLAGAFTLGLTTPGFAGDKTIAYASAQALDPTGTPLEIMLIALDLGGNHIALFLAEVSGGLATAFPALLEIASSASYSGLAVTPTETPVATIDASTTPDPNATPSPTVDASTTPDPNATPSATVEASATPNAQTPSLTPTPEIPQPPQVTGQVHLYYADGALSIYNASDTVVTIANLSLAVPDGSVYFGSNDFGYTFQRLFLPRSCIFLHLTTQAYSAPSFCRPTGTRQLTYIWGDTPTRFFAWNSGFNASDSFLVIRDGETLATCSISAGECSFDAPVRYLPYEPR